MYAGRGQNSPDVPRPDFSIRADVNGPPSDNCYGQHRASDHQKIISWISQVSPERLWLICSRRTAMIKGDQSMATISAILFRRLASASQVHE